jgi:prepilin signal peptidase PulO-like enzyme (type II secretory pathway)
MKYFLIVVAALCAVASGVYLFFFDDLLTALYGILVSILLVEWLISLQVAEIKGGTR